jgi:hypothetical protein
MVCVMKTIQTLNGRIKSNARVRPLQAWWRLIGGKCVAGVWAALLLLVFPASGTEITVSAAASLSDAMTEIGTNFEAQSGIQVRFNFGGSSTLHAVAANSGRRAGGLVFFGGRGADEYAGQKGID